MSAALGTRLRNGKDIELVVETSLPNSSRKAETISIDNDSSENVDVSSQLTEIRENNERKQMTYSRNSVS